MINQPLTLDSTKRVWIRILNLSLKKLRPYPETHELVVTYVSWLLHTVDNSPRSRDFSCDVVSPKNTASNLSLHLIYSGTWEDLGWRESYQRTLTANGLLWRLRLRAPAILLLSSWTSCPSRRCLACIQMTFGYRYLFIFFNTEGRHIKMFCLKKVANFIMNISIFKS